jgi:hypothetical protein
MALIDELRPGIQVIYRCVEEMPEEYGFVVNQARVGYVHCRFWKPDSNDLRTIENSELVPISHLTLQSTRAQRLVNQIMHQLGCESQVSEYEEHTPVLDELATIEHNQWSSWMDYVLAKCTIDTNGDHVIPKGLAEGWQHQIETEFPDLTVYEQDMDRRQIIELCHVLFAHFDQLVGKI